MTAAGRVLTATLIIALLMPVVSLLVSAMLPDVSQAPMLVYCASIAQELVMFLLPALLLGCWKGQWACGWRSRLGWLIVALAAGCAAVPALRALSGWWREVCAAPDRFLPDVNGAGERLVQIFALAVVPAVAEEAFFRGAMLGALRRTWHPAAAVLLTTAAFALMHGSLGGLMSHLVIGLVLTLLMWHTDTLLVPMAAHLVYNLLIVLGVQFPAWTAAAGGVLLGAGVALLLARIRGRESWPARKDILLAAMMLLAMAVRYFI